MENVILGIFEYSDDLSPQQYLVLPESLHLSAASTEAVLFRLLLGKVRLKNLINPNKSIEQKNNYTILPYQANRKITRNTLRNVFSIDVSSGEELQSCNRYFLRNRKNVFVHERMLNEISNCLYEVNISPISAFTHLYRCLEFMSYSFPMIYASKTRDFKGSFETLKKFLSNSVGELGFFRKFLHELFKGEEEILSFTFDINVISLKLIELKNEFDTVLQHQCTYDFEGSTLTISFINMLSLFINLRNRYFHFLIGQNRDNFNCIEFDINDLFRSVNPYLLNWIGVIFSKIIQHGFESSLL